MKSNQTNLISHPQNGQTALSIAQRLGYISVVDTLKDITEVTETVPTTDDKYKVVSPETMQETFLSDSEDEGGMLALFSILFRVVLFWYIGNVIVTYSYIVVTECFTYSHLTQFHKLCSKKD
mgnify:FL=1